LADETQAPALFDRSMDEWIAVDGHKNLVECKVKREIVPDECFIRAFKSQHGAILPALNYTLPNDTIPPPVRGPLPAKYLSAPESMIKGEGLIRKKGKGRHLITGAGIFCCQTH
jgi:hypothetical protein